MSKRECVLTIAGSDSGAGAGIQADLKTFFSLSVYGLTVITAITSQNTKGVKSVMVVSPSIVSDQLDMVLEDFKVVSFKTGMLYSRDIIKIVAEKIKEYELKNYVLDPVIFAGSGDRLLLEEAEKEMVERLFPLADVLTPNRWEGERFSGLKIESLEDAEKAARIIHSMGPKHVIIKGGHFGNKAVDVVYDGKKFYYFEKEKIYSNKKFHGAGCSFSSAICAYIAKGNRVIEAIGKAKKFIFEAVKNAFDVGEGSLPVNQRVQIPF